MRRLRLPSSASSFFVRRSNSSSSSSSALSQFNHLLILSTKTTNQYRHFSADDLFDQMESAGPLVNQEEISKVAKKSTAEKDDEFSASAAPSFTSTSPLTSFTSKMLNDSLNKLSSLSALSEDILLEQIMQLPELRSNLLSDKIEHLTAISAERREKGLQDTELEKKYGTGSSEEWIEFNRENNINNTRPDVSSASLEQITDNDAFLKLVTASSSTNFKQTNELVQQKMEELKKQSDDDYSLADLDLLFSTAMQNVLLHSRSPAEARQALDFVKLFSLEHRELTIMKKQKDEIDNDTNKKRSSLQEDESTLPSSPLIWMTAVQAAALALVTPELFSRLLDEALSQLDKCPAEFITDVLSEHQLSSFYTSALSWCSSQFDIESSMKVWGHCLRHCSSSPKVLLRNAALVIKSTNELVESSSSAGSSRNPGSGIGGSGSEDLKFSSSISNSASKYDGGVRNSMFKLLTSSNLLVSGEDAFFNDLSWSNFEAILSCFDSETQVKMMKLRMIKKQKIHHDDDNKSSKTKSDSTTSTFRNDDETIRHTIQLFELLKRLVSAADVSGAEDVSNVILNTSTTSQTSSRTTDDADDFNDEDQSTSTVLYNIQEQTITLMLSLYCEVLSPTDIDSALTLFTKYCRQQETSSSSSTKFPVKSEHYTMLLKAAQGPDDATGLFLDACAAGVVLDPAAYRRLFQTEARLPSLDLLRQSWDFKKVITGSPHGETPSLFSSSSSAAAPGSVAARLDASGAVPPLPLGADAHALRLKELEKDEVGLDGSVRRVIST